MTDTQLAATTIMKSKNMLLLADRLIHPQGNLLQRRDVITLLREDIVISSLHSPRYPTA